MRGVVNISTRTYGDQQVIFINRAHQIFTLFSPELTVVAGRINVLVLYIHNILDAFVGCFFI